MAVPIGGPNWRSQFNLINTVCVNQVSIIQIPTGSCRPTLVSCQKVDSKRTNLSISTLKQKDTCPVQQEYTCPLQQSVQFSDLVHLNDRDLSSQRTLVHFQLVQLSVLPKHSFDTQVKVQRQAFWLRPENKEIF